MFHNNFMKQLKELRKKEFFLNSTQSVLFENEIVTIKYDEISDSFEYSFEKTDINNTFKGHISQLIQEIRKSYLVKTEKKNLYKPHEGRKKTDGPKRTSFIISCYPDELLKVKELAAAENMKISEYVLKRLGIR